MNTDRMPKTWALAALFAILLSTAATATQSPLEPVDTSSPKDTYVSFIYNMKQIQSSFETNASRDEYENSIERVINCLDLSEIAPAEQVEKGKSSAIMLFEIFSRIDLPVVENIPGDETIEDDDLSSWRIPGTDIDIVLIPEGNRRGEYLFSARTVEGLEKNYAKSLNLPYREGAWENAYQIYQNIPGERMPIKWVDDMPGWSFYRVFGVALWKILSLLILLLLMSTGVKIALIITKKIEGTPGKNLTRKRESNLVFAAILLTLLRFFGFTIVEVIGVRGRLQELLIVVSYVAANLVLIFAVIMLFSLLQGLITNSKYLQKRGLNEHLIRVITQLMAALFAAFIIVRTAEYLGLQVVPILAGLGIGGVALALAARQTVENIIGGLTLFADKPVKVGDLCQYGEELGFVEEIGLRSTRLRKLDDTLVSVPNAQFSQLELENRSRRRKFLYHMVLQFRYETKVDQLRFLLVRLREMMMAHPKTIQDKSRVRFLGFGSHSLDVEVFVYIRATDWPESLSVQEDMNFRIMDIVKESGAGFAFPSTTAYIAQDGVPDEDAIRKAEESVALWKSEGRLPFPNHTRDDIRSLKSTLDYPPEGSVENKHKPDES